MLALRRELRRWRRIRRRGRRWSRRRLWRSGLRGFVGWRSRRFLSIVVKLAISYTSGPLDTDFFASNNNWYLQGNLLLEPVKGGRETFALGGSLGIMVLLNISLWQQFQYDAKLTFGSLETLGILKEAMVDILAMRGNAEVDCRHRIG